MRKLLIGRRKGHTLCWLGVLVKQQGRCPTNLLVGSIHLIDATELAITAARRIGRDVDASHLASGTIVSGSYIVPLCLETHIGLRAWGDRTLRDFEVELSTRIRRSSDNQCIDIHLQIVSGGEIPLVKISKMSPSPHES